ncbi:MAG: UDP-N-acetylmuramate dehydrogenase [Oscillospiraceae bacterium]|nr:UDP-N-acetylmuramate dehydrogenase [Oscillospiraceae bacterium]MBR4578292.1 UDP-N-acetylmuramate dehydrogenase [Oscillospiraceae bacterium]MBR6208744.1 UDP-N-acetylmuramate dehydrogenase [Oscillospiraceae bacterium]
MRSSLLQELKSRCPELVILPEEPMAKHCSFRIGGIADAMLLPSSPEEAETVCRVLRQAGEAPLLMGNGTNLLVTDAPLHRMVLRLGEGFSRISVRGNTLHSESGALLSQLATAAARAGLTGLEFAHGIPGSVGGGVSMNAGAYGGEMKDAVVSVVYLDEELCLRETEDPDFSYRHSMFSGTEQVVLSADFRLSEGDETAIREKMRQLMAKRKASQPLELPSAGSTFKRPVGGYAAALIDQAGLKGVQIGGAAVSEKHAGFVVNRGGASFDDVLRLMDLIQETVLQRFGISLEPEVKIIRS